MQWSHSWWCRLYQQMAGQVGLVVMLWIFIVQVLRWHLFWRRMSWFSQSLQVPTVSTVPLNKPRPLPSRFSPTFDSWSSLHLIRVCEPCSWNSIVKWQESSTRLSFLIKCKVVGLWKKCDGLLKYPRGPTAVHNWFAWCNLWK